MFLLFLNKKSLIVLGFNVHSFFLFFFLFKNNKLEFIFVFISILFTKCFGDICMWIMFLFMFRFSFCFRFCLFFCYHFLCLLYLLLLLYLLSFAFYIYLGIHTDITMLLCYVSVFVIDSECPDWVPYGYTHLHYVLCVCCLSASHRTTYSIQYLVWYVYSMHIGLLACDLR